jgi:TRAP-type C4-dicarboxylate transport system substrate-binding protein
MRPTRPSAAFLLAAALTVGAAGCAEPSGKSGGSAAVVLRLAVAELPGEPAARLAGRLARRVAALSHGSLRVSITSTPASFESTSSTGQAEAGAIRLVRSNTTQLAIVPSSAFRAQGVTTLQALQTPFLITSLALAARVTAGPIADRLQAGLGRISLAGLALVPEGLQRPFGFEKALVTPADFDQVAVRADSSAVTTSLLRALGARPVGLDDPDVDTAVHTGFVGGAEAIPATGDVFPRHAHTAGNIAFFPRVDVVAVNAAAFGRLTVAEQAILRHAAQDARAGTIAAADERAGAAAYCKGGGSIVTAPASALRSLGAATVPVVAALRRDAATRALIASIRRVPARRGDELPACRAPEAAPYTGPRVISSPPDGSYRRVFSVTQLRASGAGQSEADDNKGVTTLTFAHGRFVLEWQSGAHRAPCDGRVVLTDGLVELRWDRGASCSGYVAFAWTLAGRDLSMVALDPRHGAGWVTRAYPGTWRRVE